MERIKVGTGNSLKFDPVAFIMINLEVIAPNFDSVSFVIRTYSFILFH